MSTTVRIPRNGIIIAGLVLVVVLIVATRRALWVAAIKRKWGPANPFILESTYDSTWATYKLRELMLTYWSGQSAWNPTTYRPPTDDAPGQ